MWVLELNKHWKIRDRCANRSFLWFFFFNGKQIFLFFLNGKVLYLWYISFRPARVIICIDFLFVFLLFLIIFSTDFVTPWQAGGIRHCLPVWINRRHYRSFSTSPAMYLCSKIFLYLISQEGFVSPLDLSSRFCWDIIWIKEIWSDLTHTGSLISHTAECQTRKEAVIFCVILDITCSPLTLEWGFHTVPKVALISTKYWGLF